MTLPKQHHITPFYVDGALEPLGEWASSPHASRDLESIFGLAFDLDSAARHLAAWERRDFSTLPPVSFLPSGDMPGLWGGYSRDLNRIFISDQCPAEKLSEVLIEEIGHFLDREICATETPGEEGAEFAVLVLGLSTDHIEADDTPAFLCFEGHRLLVEAARRKRGKRGSGKSKKNKSKKGKSGGGSRKRNRGKSKNAGVSTKQRGAAGGGDSGGGSSASSRVSSSSSAQKNSPKDDTWLNQETASSSLRGSFGDDVFDVTSADVKLIDPAGIDTIRSPVSFSLLKYPQIENLQLTGYNNIYGVGNFKSNIITGNSGANSLNGESGSDTLFGLSGDDTLDGGSDSAVDVLVGGAGDDNYVLRSSTDENETRVTVDVIVEADDEGSDTIWTPLQDASLAKALEHSFKKISQIESDLSLDERGIPQIENIAFIGPDYAVENINDIHGTLTGNNLKNILYGWITDDFLYGGDEADTLIGGAGDDNYIVKHDETVVLEIEEVSYVDANGVSVTVPGGLDTLSTNLPIYSIDKFANVEVLKYTGNSNSSLTGNKEDNTIYGGTSVRNTIDGGLENDYLVGGDTTDSLYGGKGDDTLLVANWKDLPITGKLGAVLRDSRGSDTLNGGDGADWYIVDSQTAYTFIETDENDSDGARINPNTVASTADFSLKYNPNIANSIQNLFLIGITSINAVGSEYENTITGNDGDNRIQAGDGDDSVFGGFGSDIIDGQSGNDSIIGGGEPQTDIPPSRDQIIEVNGEQETIEGKEGNETPIDLDLEKKYTGRIEYNGDTDWIRVKLKAGSKYYFRINPDLSQSPSVLQEFSDIAFGSNDYQAFSPDGDYFGIVGGLFGHNYYLVDQNGDRAYGIFDTQDVRHPADDQEAQNIFKNAPKRWEQDNVRAFSFTAFNDGDFFIQVTGSGPAVGSYTVYFSQDSDLLDVNKYDEVIDANAFILADTGSNLLIGGKGSDTIISSNPRGEDFYGDTLLGGTNGIPGGFDLDSIEGENKDSLVGGKGGDCLDGGLGADTMVGGSGNDTYFIDDLDDVTVESDDGGADDLGVFFYGAEGNFSENLQNGLFTFRDEAELSSLSGVGFDIDLDTSYNNLDHASLMGSSELYILGSRDRNSLWGNFGNNLLVGAAGDDTLMGQGGNDYLIGCDGGDLLDGGSGQNTLDGGYGDDTYVINDRNDRIIHIEDTLTGEFIAGEVSGLDGGIDVVRTYFNFDPIQGTALEQFQPDVADNSPSVTKAPSFASIDLKSFYNLEKFELLGQAVYGVGNALGNSLKAGESAALLLGMGGEDALTGGAGDDSLFGDTPIFYATPDLYAPAPTDTRTQEFVDGVVGSYGSDYLEGGAGNDFLDGGKGFDTMIGGEGSDTFVQDHVDDYIVATGGAGNELISSVNIDKAPDGISRLMLVVKEQERDEGGNSITGQDQVASFASFLDSEGGNDRGGGISAGTASFSVEDANTMELLYGTAKAEVFSNTGDAGHLSMEVGPEFVDPNDNTKVAYELSWSAIDPGDHAEEDPIIGYSISYREAGTELWLTYVVGSSQDFQGTTANPSLVVDNLDSGKTYEFKAEGRRRSVPVTRDEFGNATGQSVVTLQGGAGNDQVSSVRLIRSATPLQNDLYRDPYIWNNILDPLPSGFLFAPLPVDPSADMRSGFATYLDGGFGNDLLCGWTVNDASGLDYTLPIKQWSADGVTSTTADITFRGLNTMAGGQGSDTFIVRNGGRAIGDEFDWVIKYGNETPVDYGDGGLGESLNGGQHNVIASAVPFLTLSDTEVHQGMFIDQVVLTSAGQFAMGNRLDNFLSDGLNGGGGSSNTLVGNTGRDSIHGGAFEGDVLIGGTAYGVDNVGFAIRDFASVADGGHGLTRSIFRDTDPIPTDLNGPGTADPSQFWSIPGFYKYGEIFDFFRNQDTLVAADQATLDGGAGYDSLVGNNKGDNFFVSVGSGGIFSQDIFVGDAVFGNGGNDTVTFTDSDYLWWDGHEEGETLEMHGYAIAGDISNLVLQMGAPTARDGTGNASSTGNPGTGSNLIVGNEFDNILFGGGVGATGIDTLIGDGNVDVDGDGVIDLDGSRGSDNFIVDDGKGAPEYRGATTWGPEIESADADDVAGTPARWVWNREASVYKDDDFVVIQDFEPGDILTLNGNLDEFSIGALPSSESSKSLGSINVKPSGLGGSQEFTGNAFGIYYTGAVESHVDPFTGAITTIGNGAPELVAVIKSSTDLLDANGDGALGFDANFDGVQDNELVARNGYTDAIYLKEDYASAPRTMGWGQFYELSTSNFAQYVDQPYTQQASTASLSTLINEIVII